MANKRMFSMLIVDSDAFLDMPLSSQCLYFHLCMRADDDGFVSNPKRIQRMISASEDDLKLLIAKRFLLRFEDGVVVIKHWRMHNSIRYDRYTPTVYADDLKQLGLKPNKAYTLAVQEALATTCQPCDIPTGNQLATNGCQDDANSSYPGLGLDIGIDKDKGLVEEKPSKKKTAEAAMTELLSGYNISQPVLDKLEDWYKYKKEQFRYTYKPTSLKAFLTKMQKHEQAYGASVTIHDITFSMENGWKGVYHDKDMDRKPAPKGETVAERLERIYGNDQ